MERKIVWKVGDKPVGRYRSFEKRPWPTAYWDNVNGPCAAMITCADSYEPCEVKKGNHGPLTLRIARYKGEQWDWATARVTYNTLEEAKKAAYSILSKYPHIHPPIENKG